MGEDQLQAPGFLFSYLPTQLDCFTKDLLPRRSAVQVEVECAADIAKKVMSLFSKV